VELFCATLSQWLSKAWAHCHFYWNRIHIHHDWVYLVVPDSPTSLGMSKVMYLVKNRTGGGLGTRLAQLHTHPCRCPDQLV